MARTDMKPAYMEYTENPNTYEYDIFPEKYFSGSNVAILFNNVQVTQTGAFGFTVQEQHRPVYGYASRTFDQMAIGNRIVVGQIKIPFTDARYMRNILERVEAALNATASEQTDILVDNRITPGWMTGAVGKPVSSTGTTASSDNTSGEFPKLGKIAGVSSANMRSGPGTNSGIVKTLTKGEEFDVLGVNTSTSSTAWLQCESYGVKGYVYRDYVVCTTGVGAMPTGISLVKYKDSNDSVKKVQEALNKDPKVVAFLGSKIPITGNYADMTLKAVNYFKQQRLLIVDDEGVVGPNTWRHLSIL